MESSKVVDMPIHKRIELFKKMAPANQEDKAKMKNKQYAQVVLSVMYVMLYTRLHRSYVMSLVSRF